MSQYKYIFKELLNKELWCWEHTSYV